MTTNDSSRYFVSYAREDADFALKLAKELRASGANLWVDKLDIIGGQKWDRAVEKALKASEGMLVVLTPTAVNSDNVMDEVSFALGQKKVVVPVLLEECEIPFRLHRVQHVNFTGDYEQGFKALLRALQIEAPVAETASPPVSEERQQEWTSAISAELSEARAKLEAERRQREADADARLDDFAGGAI